MGQGVGWARAARATRATRAARAARAGQDGLGQGVGWARAARATRAARAGQGGQSGHGGQDYQGDQWIRALKTGGWAEASKFEAARPNLYLDADDPRAGLLNSL